MRAIPCAPGTRRGQTKVFPLLVIPLLFLAAVRRFLAESYTDIPFLLRYDSVDVSVLHTLEKCDGVKDLKHCMKYFVKSKFTAHPRKSDIY